MLSALREHLYSLYKFPWTFKQVFQEACWNVIIQDKREINFSPVKLSISIFFVSFSSFLIPMKKIFPKLLLKGSDLWYMDKWIN